MTSPSSGAGGAPRTDGRLERCLRAGHFALTAEIAPPASGAAADLLAKAAPLRGLADAVNVTDGASARVAMASLAAAAILHADGIEPVMQMTCRDRNRIALQSDVLGAAALGIPNILMLRGDAVEAGDQKDARAVFDYESSDLLAAAHAMRARGLLPSGRALGSPPRLFLGAAEIPGDPEAGWRPDRLAAKAAAGADFVQTQFCFDLSVIRRFAARLKDDGLSSRLFVLVGIGPIASARSARWMRDNLFGARIPDAVITRLEGAKDARAEGVRICLELLAELAEVPGVHGAHLMAPLNDAAVAEVISESGLLARRAGGAD